MIEFHQFTHHSQFILINNILGDNSKRNRTRCNFFLIFYNVGNRANHCHHFDTYFLALKKKSYLSRYSMIRIFYLHLSSVKKNYSEFDSILLEILRYSELFETTD